MPRKALVTGGAGFIGSHICDALTKKDWSVCVLDDLSTGLQTNVPSAAEFHRGDILSPGDIERAIAGCDTVFHLAASVSVAFSLEQPAESFRQNAMGTLNVIEAARQARVKSFVYSASSAAYGDRPESPKHEDLAPMPLSAYAAGKLAGEEIVSAYAHTFGMSTVSLRYFNIFGPRQRPDSQYAAAIPIFLSRMIAGQTLTVYGDGEQTRDFTYVSNVVDANIRAAETPGLKGEVINCATGESITVNELIKELSRVTGIDPKVEHVPPRAGEARHSNADVRKGEALIGYKKLVDWREGLRLTVEATG